MSFNDLGLIAPIQKAVESEGYTNPTPIQAQAIPLILAGNDVLGCAQTGTGKTAAFSIPVLQNLTQNPNENPRNRHIRVLILTPTRELAIQIKESLDVYGKNLKLRNTVVFGGVKQFGQTETLNRGVDILVATPGRLLDLMGQGYISLKNLEVFILDEADRMLDMGFVHDVKRIIQHLPTKRQSLFFSATMPKEIQALADQILVNPKKVEVTPVSSTAATIQQQVFFVDKADKVKLLSHMLKDETINPVLIFTRTKFGADKLVKILNKQGVSSAAIHGNKSQNARQDALNHFKNGKLRVLVATDIAARGIDIDDLAYVINFEIPNISETYVHRIGRTGRAGASGTAFSFCDAEEYTYWKDIQKLTGIKVPMAKDNPFHLEPPADAKPPVKVQGHQPKPQSNKKNASKNFTPWKNKKKAGQAKATTA